MNKFLFLLAIFFGMNLLGALASVITCALLVARFVL